MFRRTCTARLHQYSQVQLQHITPCTRTMTRWRQKSSKSKTQAANHNSKHHQQQTSELESLRSFMMSGSICDETTFGPTIGKMPAEITCDFSAKIPDQASLQMEKILTHDHFCNSTANVLRRVIYEVREDWEYLRDGSNTNILSCRWTWDRIVDRYRSKGR